MRHQKRQRESTDRRLPRSKKPKHSLKESSTQESDEDRPLYEGDSGLWTVVRILDEKQRPGKPTEYLCEWDSIDPATGKVYVPDWQPARNLTKDLIDEWKACKKSGDTRTRPVFHTQASYNDDEADGTESAATRLHPETLAKRASGRPRVIEDSSESEISSSAAPSPRAGAERRNTRLPNHSPPHRDNSAPSTPPLSASRDNNFRQFESVFVTQKSDFDRDDYLVGLSQATQGTQSAEEPQAEVASATRARQPSLQPLVIPDSQSQSANGIDINDFAESIERSSSPHKGSARPNSQSSRVRGTAFSKIELVSDPIEYTLPIKGEQAQAFDTPDQHTSPHIASPESPVDGSLPLIGRGSLRSASRTPPRVVHFSQSSPKPSPLRKSAVPSPEADDLKSGTSHQEVFGAWRSSGATSKQSHQELSRLSAELAEQPQSTNPGGLGIEFGSSSSIPDPPTRDPETLASNLPPPLDHSSMAGTRRSQRGPGPSTATATQSSSSSSATQSTRGGRRKAPASAPKKDLASNPPEDEGNTKIEPDSDDDLDLDDKIGTGLNSSAESIADGELQSQALLDEPLEPEPVMDHDELGNSRLAARIPGEGQDETEESTMQSPPLTRPEDPARDATGASATESDIEETGPPLGQMEFIVPLPFAGQARDQYRKTVKYNEALIEKFTGRKWSEDPSTLIDAEAFVQTMRDITTHVDLTNETASTQTDVDLVVEWDRSVSTKYKVLYDLLRALKASPIHIAIVSQPGKALEIMENFLRGMDVRYSRGEAGSASPDSDGTSELNVTTLPLDMDWSSLSGSGLALVLIFDYLTDSKKLELQNLRTGSTSSGRLAPLVALAVVNSVDHIEHSVVPMFSGAQRLRIIVNCLAKLRKEAGKNDLGLPSVEESALAIATFVLASSPEDQWTLPPIGLLAHNDTWDLSQGLVTMKSSNSSDSEKSAKAKAAAKKSQKRPLDRIQDDLAEEESSKKMRMTPQPESQPEQDASTTRVSDSTVVQSAESQKAASEIAAMAELLKATEEKSRSDKQSLERQLQEVEKSLSELQFRYEEQTAARRVLQKEISESKTLLENAGQRFEAREGTIDKLKQDVRDLRLQLEDARAALGGSQIPEIAAMDKLRQEKEDAENAKRKADKNAASNESMVGYLRQQLEETRNRAIELSEENDDLKSRMPGLERQANGEISKARQLFLDERGRGLSLENTRLQQEKRNLEQLLSRKEDELKNRKVGMGTRAGSVPRSPRVGPVSRGGSPIPDRRIGALKSNSMMGGSRRQSKAAKQENPDAAKAVVNSTPVIQEPKPKPGRPIEMKALEAGSQESKKGSQSKPPAEPIPPAPRQEIRTTANASRPFPCVFAQYNCGSAFTSKNEWKRHISTKHIQLGFWRCDMCPPSPGIDHPVYNDFNRKDLFTQHLRRMHAVNAPATLLGSAESKDLPPQPPVAPGSPNAQTLTEDQITEIQKRCYRQLRNPPDTSSCVFCPRPFSGPNSWDERLEHVGGHLERDRKNGTACLDVSSWRPDPPLRDYLVTEGLVEIDPRGGYRIGDGKPKRPLDIEGFAGQAPTAQLTPRAAQDPMASPAGGKDSQSMEIDDSEGSVGKRRRGRPPKQQPIPMEIDIPPSSTPNTQQGPQTPSGHPLGQNIQSPPESHSFGPPQPSGTPQGPPPGQQSRPPQGPPPEHMQGPPQGPPPGHPQGPPGPPSHMFHPNQQGPPPGHHLQHPQPHGPPQHGPPPGHPAHQGPPPHHMQSPREGIPPPFSQPMHPGPPQSPRQYHAPPSNIQPMYEWRHGTFTKFSGMPTTTQFPALTRPVEGLSHANYPRGPPGQPQLAPKPAPNPVEEILSRIQTLAPQLAPKPMGHEGSRDMAGSSPRPPSQHSQQGGPPQQQGSGPAQFHGGFRPINEGRRPEGPPQHVPVAPKPPQETQRQDGGGRQLAPKPASQAPQQQSQAGPPMSQPFQAFAGSPQQKPQQHSQSQSQPASAPELAIPQPHFGSPGSRSAPPLQPGPGPQLAPAPSPRPTTPKAAGSGAEMDDGQRGSQRGRSFRDIVMS